MATGKRKASYRRVAEGVYERNGKYHVRAWNPETGKTDWSAQKRAGGPFETIEQAEDFRRDSKRDKRRHEQSRETVKEFSRRWARDFPAGRGESTVEHNAERIRKFVEDFEDRELGSITRPEARKWALENRRRIPQVRSMLNDAMNDGLIDVNPFANLRIPAASKGRRREEITILETEELDKLIELARIVHGDYGVVYAAMVQFAASSGMRPGEIYGLERPDVDFRARKIHVRQQRKRSGKMGLPKNKQERAITLFSRAAEAIKSVPPQVGSETIFFSKRGKKFSGRVAHYYWDPVRKAFWAQLPKHRQERIKPDFDFYELRHYCATKMREAGATPEEVGHQLGHTDNGRLAMDTYFHLDHERTHKRMLELDQASAGAL